MRRSQYAIPRVCDGLQRRHGLAEISERGAVVFEERKCVKPPHFKRFYIIFAENASRHGYHFLQHTETTTDAYNYAVTLAELKRYAEVKALLHKAVPVARRVLGENHEVTLKMRWTYAMARLQGHTRDREAVTTLEDVARITRRVFGGAHPMAVGVDRALRNSRSVLAARETRQEP